MFTVLPHFVLRYRRVSPDVARQALIATHGGLSLEGCDRAIPHCLYRQAVEARSECEPGVGSA